MVAVEDDVLLVGKAECSTEDAFTGEDDVNGASAAFSSE